MQSQFNSLIVIYSRTKAASYGTIKIDSRINKMMKNMTQNKALVVYKVLGEFALK